MTAIDFAKEPWKHPAAWKSHLVRMTRQLQCNVVSQVATCECGWSICAAIKAPPYPGIAAVNEAVFDHWRAVIAETEDVAA